MRAVPMFARQAERGRAPGAVRGGIARDVRSVLFGGARRRRQLGWLTLLLLSALAVAGVMAVAPARARLPPPEAHIRPAPPPPGVGALGGALVDPLIAGRGSRALGLPGTVTSCAGRSFRPAGRTGSPGTPSSSAPPTAARGAGHARSSSRSSITTTICTSASRRRPRRRPRDRRPSPTAARAGGASASAAGRDTPSGRGDALDGRAHVAERVARPTGEVGAQRRRETLRGVRGRAGHGEQDLRVLVGQRLDAEGVRDLAGELVAGHGAHAIRPRPDVAVRDPGVSSGAVRGLFVTSTDTGVGKTAVTCVLATTLVACGERVVAFKPVLTGLDEAEADRPADDERLAAAATVAVAPHRYGPPVSPHLAAALAGERLDVAGLAAEAREAAAYAEGATLLVEGAGGLLVPLNERETLRDLAVALGLPLLVAARPGLGTINHTLLTLESARAAGLRVAAVVLTPWPAAPSAVERSNRETITRLGEVEVVALPRDGSALKPWPAALQGLPRAPP